MIEEGSDNKNEINNVTSMQEVSEKMQHLDSLLQKDLFSNPVRQVQENIRNELLEFKNIFGKNLLELESYIVNNRL